MVDSAQAKALGVREDVRSNRTLIWAFLVIGTLVNTFLAYLVSTAHIVPISPVQLSGITAEGPTVLCAGDTLDYSFVLTAKQDATVSLDSATYRVTEPNGVAAWGDTRRTVMTAGTESEVQMRWFIPTRYWDWATGEEREFQPGEYLRLVSIGTTSRQTVPSIQTLPFTVRADCR